MEQQFLSVFDSKKFTDQKRSRTNNNPIIHMSLTNLQLRYLKLGTFFFINRFKVIKPLRCSGLMRMKETKETIL